MSQSGIISVSAAAGIVDSVTGINGVVASPTTGNVVVSGVNATTITVGVASFNARDFTVTAGAVSLGFAYTNVTHAMSPYTVLATDHYLSVDCSAGVVTINLPDAPPDKTQYIIKDRLGNSSIDAITIKSLTGASTMDTEVSYILGDNFEAISVVYHSSNYELF